MHNLDMTNDRANIAFVGSRDDVWHRMGQEMKPGQSIGDWAIAAGLAWRAVKVPALAQLPNGETRRIPGQSFLMRDDTYSPLGYVSGETDQKGYQTVQPRELLEWFIEYISQDTRFSLDVAGSLKGGKIVWATATFNGDMKVAGDSHKARLLMTTSFDGTMATVNQATMTRTVCNNTLRIALNDRRAVVRTAHNTKFHAERVREELAGIARDFDAYREMGDAMARVTLTNGDLSKFFKAVLDIPFDAKEADVSTRKMNQFNDLRRAYAKTVAEGTPANTAWTALNAVTRYVDHDRAARGGQAYGGEDVARFLSANWGSGNDMKQQAAAMLAKYAGQEAAGVPVSGGLAAAAFG